MKAGFGIACVLAVSLEVTAQSPRPDGPPPDLSTLSLEQLMTIEVVRAASRFDQNPREAPATVTVVTAAEIRQFGWRTLDEVLRSVRGLTITSDRNYSYVGVRGLSRPGDFNSRLLVLIDGHRVNENVYEAAIVEGSFSLDVDLIDRVEVVRGPGSSLYGANAFFGVVNVITKAPRDVGTAEVSGSAASFGSYGGRFTAGTLAADGLEAMASGSIFSSKGQTLFYPEFGSAANGGIVSGADGERFRSLFGKATWAGVTLQSAWVSREKGVPTGSFGTLPGDPRNRTVDGTWYFDLSTTKDLGGGLDLSARASYNRDSYDEDYIYVASPDVVNHDTSRGTWWGGEAVFGYSGLAGHRLLLGAEFQDNVRQYFANFDVDPYRLVLREDDSSIRWAAFAQDEWRVSKALLLSLGARLDHYQSFGRKVSPRLAAVLMPDAETTVKVVLGSAFRAPSQYEREYELPASGQKKNLGLGPETIRSGELTVEHFFGENLQVGVMGFAYKIDGLVSFRVDPADGLLQYQNGDTVDGSGVEAEVTGRWHTVAARLSLSLQDVRTAGSNAWLTNSPRELGKLHVTVPLHGESLSAGLEALYTGRRLTLQGKVLPGVVVTNLTLLSRSLLPGLTLSATVTNLFDRAYSDPASEEHVQDALLQDGRAFRVRAAIRF